MLRGARDLLSVPDPVEAELTASLLISPWWMSRERAESMEDALADGVVGYAVRQRSREALALLRAVSKLGPRSVRAKAGAAADGLSRSGVAEPPWRLAELRPRECWVLLDTFGDEEAIVVDFGDHTVVVLADHNRLGAAVDAMVGEKSRAAVALLATRMTGTAVSPEEAGVRLTRALSRSRLLAVELLSEDLCEAWAFLLRRAEALPGGTESEAGPADGEAPVREFLGSAHATGLPGEAESLARLIVGHDPGQPDRVSPAKVTGFLRDWLPGHAVLTAAQEQALREVLEAWTRFAGERRGLPASAVRQVETAILEWTGELDELNARYAAGDHETLARRRFAVPYTLLGEDAYATLDLAEGRDRRLLIEMEHPLQRDVLHDPQVQEIGGVNPRLHIVAHATVADQLWNDDPPVVWQTAKRLMSQGYDRRQALAMIADALVEDLRHTIADDRPPTSDGYIERLNALPNQA
ncbi:DUF1841 family protein [Rhizohabitans arisaemae]|uniref:DUF1841 family protein n=1 Tax=Rhizohabitans arisaemae TaxID=2720610 RepID=UPI0024B156DC|nr:DUF1841 family protein [Rhizohabitans arisaemae]